MSALLNVVLADVVLVRKDRKVRKKVTEKAAEISVAAVVVAEEADIAKVKEVLHVNSVIAAREQRAVSEGMKSAHLHQVLDLINQGLNVPVKAAETRTPQTLSVNTDNDFLF
jgi:hypothetical protein